MSSSDQLAGIGEYNLVIKSMDNPRVTNLLLENGAKIENSEEFWRKTFGVMRFQGNDTVSIVRDVCFMYVLIKHGCNINTAIQEFYDSAFNPCCEYTPEEVLFYMLYLLQVNIEPPSWCWEGLEFLAGEVMDGDMCFNVDIPLLQKIEGKLCLKS